MVGSVVGAAVPWSGPWSGLWSGRVAGVVEAAAHTRSRRAGLARARVAQSAAAGPPPKFGGQDDTVVDFLGPPPVDVQQQTVQRPPTTCFPLRSNSRSALLTVRCGFRTGSRLWASRSNKEANYRIWPTRFGVAGSHTSIRRPQLPWAPDDMDSACPNSERATARWATDRRALRWILRGRTAVWSARALLQSLALLEPGPAASGRPGCRSPRSSRAPGAHWDVGRYGSGSEESGRVARSGPVNGPGDQGVLVQGGHTHRCGVASAPCHPRSRGRGAGLVQKRQGSFDVPGGGSEAHRPCP